MRAKLRSKVNRLGVLYIQSICFARVFIHFIQLVRHVHIQGHLVCSVDYSCVWIIDAN